LALANYQTAMTTFPLCVNGSKGYSAHSMLLQFLDQPSIYNAINFDLRNSHRANRTARACTLSVFQCPSDPRASEMGATSYASNVGYAYQIFGWNGAFTGPPDYPTSPAAFLDGMSTTVAMAEWVLTPGKETTDIGSVFRVPVDLSKPAQFDAFVSACQSTTSVNAISFPIGYPWINGSPGETSYNHNMIINSKSCFNNTYVLEGAWTVGSRHPSLANGLLADGHVASMKATISSRVWRALGTRAGEEVVDSDSY
jgi:prepilin-type processing-associated H-X9-DG protein